MLEIRQTEPHYTPDIYFTEGYGRVEAQTIGGSWQTIADASGSWQMPLLVSELKDGLREAVSPYGYSGIYASHSPKLGSLSVWPEVHELLLEQNIVSLFLRFVPYDRPSLESACTIPNLDIRRTGATYLVHITTAETIWQNMQGRARTTVRKAQKQHMTATVRAAVYQDFLEDSPFRILYEDTMRRATASARYFFERDYYLGLLSAMGSGLMIAEVRLGATVVASSLIFTHKKLAHYHLSGSDLDGARLGANSLMIWTVLDWCANHGFESFHMGGGGAGGDGLDRFKRSFGGQQLDFFTGRYIVDTESYDHLCRGRAQAIGASVAELEQSDFFPIFRATL